MTRHAGNHLVATASACAGFSGVQPHRLRHSCGSTLIGTTYDLRFTRNDLGHRDPRHTVGYTPAEGRRSEGFQR
ncbi:hypothetical protein E0493_21760 [Roseomonas sp. M0104]|uniref:Tyr recombinase domain-containing protein n=1 Tax=Teichococcus coralli TaxID=2545983 RepID=A0A845BL42_9PROT|nr:hypothetical protein [Pseudoroseomonas coralli]